MPKQEQYDWETIKIDYCAGKQSIRQIAKLHGCSDTVIRKRAKKNGWERQTVSLAKAAPNNLPELASQKPELTIEVIQVDGVKRVRMILPGEPYNDECLAELFGTESVETNHFMTEILSVLKRDSIEKQVAQTRAMLPVLRAIAPKDELEGLLAVQMISIHNASMKLMRQFMGGNASPEHMNLNINQIAKLNRVFIAQMDALNKNRGKGHQKVEVRHIHVNEGGQAIVGNVEQGDRGHDKKN